MNRSEQLIPFGGGMWEIGYLSHGDCSYVVGNPVLADGRCVVTSQALLEQLGGAKAVLAWEVDVAQVFLTKRSKTLFDVLHVGGHVIFSSRMRDIISASDEAQNIKWLRVQVHKEKKVVNEDYFWAYATHLYRGEFASSPVCYHLCDLVACIAFSDALKTDLEQRRLTGFVMNPNPCGCKIQSP
jgi:hypothetical protein